MVAKREIPEKTLTKIIKEYFDNSEATIPVLAKQYGYSSSFIYKKLKEKNIKLHKAGWNNMWRGGPAGRKNGRFVKRRAKYRELNIAKSLEKQNYKCLICRDPIDEPTACLDHCHRTDKIRGFLCGHCNRGLGCLKDNVKNMERAIKYIKKYG